MLGNHETFDTKAGYLPMKRSGCLRDGEHYQKYILDCTVLADYSISKRDQVICLPVSLSVMYMSLWFSHNYSCAVITKHINKVISVHTYYVVMRQLTRAENWQSALALCMGTGLDSQLLLLLSDTSGGDGLNVTCPQNFSFHYNTENTYVQ